ncbi:MAG: hypothetical protein K2H16_10085, partial [Prevotella sp.]|nr:hypothetical protein [Prevotella sp.]
MQSGIRRTGNRMLVADCLATEWPGYHDGCQQQWRWTCLAACIAAFHSVAGYVQVVSCLLECRVHAYAGRLRQRRGTPPCMPLASHVGTSLGLTQYDMQTGSAIVWIIPSWARDVPWCVRRA